MSDLSSRKELPWLTVMFGGQKNQIHAAGETHLYGIGN
jgi:hypothetical protein